MKTKSLLSSVYQQSLDVLQPLLARLPARARAKDMTNETLTYCLDYYSDENMDDLFDLLGMLRRDFNLKFTFQHFDRSQPLCSPDFCQVLEVLVVRQGRVAFIPETFPAFEAAFDYPGRAVVGFFIAHPTVDEILFESFETWQSYAENCGATAEARNTKLVALYDEGEPLPG